MQQLMIRLYQPDDQLTARLPGGSNALVDFVQMVGETLNQPEFEHPPQENRALVIAISPTGKVIGWAIDQTGNILHPEQDVVDRTLHELTPPTVVHGAIVLAIHYAETLSGDNWVPFPQEWNDILKTAGEPIPVDKLVMHYFETL